MSSDTFLEVLPPELQQRIMLHLENLDTLHSLIHASPRLYQVFLLTRESILSTITLSQFHPAVQSEAMAVARLAHLQHQLPHDRQSQRDMAIKFCNTFPTQIHSWCESNDKGPVSIQLCKLEKVVRFFILDYARNCLPILDQLGQSQDLDILSEYPPFKDVSQLQLSSTEIGRLQRSFCRIELYRHLFSRCFHDIPDGIHKCLEKPSLKAAEQAIYFLQDLPVFQITEIACIRDYFFRRLRGIWDELENEAVRTLPLKEMTFRRSNVADRWRSPFYLFTTQAKIYQLNHIEHLMSLGLPYIRRIMESTGYDQRDLFLHYIDASVLDHVETQFLTEALYLLGHNPSFRDYDPSLVKKEFTPACDEDGYSELPQGWLWGQYHLEPYRLWNKEHKGLRDWGYVFWDYDRLRDSGILRRE